MYVTKEVPRLRQKRDWLQRLTDGADLPGEPAPGQPLVELAGDRRVLIEHHRGVTQYGREKICVKVKFGQVAICGCGLELARMTREQLVICGRIDSISLQRRNG
jgi:sporulation protein YqfC